MPSSIPSATVTTAAPPSRKLAAFFDVDNTLIPGVAIEVRFFGFLLARGLVGISEALQSIAHLVSHMPPVSLHPLRVRKLYLEGKQPATIEPIAHEFVRAQIFSRVSREGLAVLESHRRAGHHIVLITGSLDFLIAPLAVELGIDSVLAARPEQQGPHYTGHVVPPLPYGVGKQRLVEGFASQHHMELQECYAYGDSPGDLEILQSVGYPRVVNPIRGMTRVARRRGWPIVRWT